MDHSRFSRQYFQNEHDTSSHSHLDYITRLDYFHPNLKSIHEVGQELMDRINQNGSFLLRRSFTQPGAFTVSVVHDQSIKHIKILQKLEKFYLHDQLFDTFNELVTFYSRNDVPNMEQVKGVRFIYPILRADRLHMSHSLETQRKLPHVHSYPNMSQTKKPGRSSSFSEQSASDTHEGLSYPERYVPSPSDSTINCGKSIHRAEQIPKQQRPPIPLPEEAQAAPKDGIYDGVYYSRIKEENKLPDLLKVLSHESPDDQMFCACGLDLELSQLPQGWSVHICDERDEHYGRPFFMDASDATSWDLPNEVRLEMTSQQEQMIRFLTDNYNSGKPLPDRHQLKKWLLKFFQEQLHS